MNNIGIFTGKQKGYDVKLLNLLYDNEPLSAWELTAKIRKVGRQSLHSTLSKRLRSLEDKGYVLRREKKWHLRFKGIIAVLLIQSEPKMWNPKWAEIFEENAKIAAEHTDPIFKLDTATVQEVLKSLGLCLDDFNEWLNVSNKVKELIEAGIINFDLIKEPDLLALIIMKTKTLEQLSAFWQKSGSSS